MAEKQSENRLTAYVTPLGAWALALGTCIGWGSLVVTSNAYLLQAGPLGSIIGILIGAALMLVISRNYHYLIGRYPDAGGAYAYAKAAFGYDYGFLTAWFLVLTYAAMFWANATSLPLFARYFLNGIFQFGSTYSIFGYDVYLGEILLTMAFILLTALICVKNQKLALRLVIGMALLLTVCITVCFLGMAAGHGARGQSMDPAMLPEKNELMQVIRIACISPWAFIGFENISHASEEFTFPRSRVFRILALAVFSALALYIFVLLLSVSAYPPQYGSWLEYIGDLGNISGIEGLPAFYAAHVYLGSKGVFMLLLALLGLIFTSLIGNMLALSRLLYAMARDHVMPQALTAIKMHSPTKAIMLITAFSLIIPFFGRTAIGWIVDVTTIGATSLYAFVSAAALKIARQYEDKTETYTGLWGLILTLVILIYILVSNLFFTGTMESESFLLFTVWAILGFLFFRWVLRVDKAGRFGRSIIVWIVLLALIFFTSLTWMGTAAMNGSSLRIHMAVVVGVFAIALAMLLSNYALINRRMEESERALASAREKANKDPLTGVKSKNAFIETQIHMDSKIRAGGENRFAVAVCDVNGLKKVNDTLGHQAGDEYICEASRLICELFQHSPVFRTGGDEFAVILTGRDFNDRRSIMRRLHEISVENISLGKVIVAGGIADFTDERDNDLQSVYQRADQSMYEEKAALKEIEAQC